MITKKFLLTFSYRKKSQSIEIMNDIILVFIFALLSDHTSNKAISPVESMTTYYIL